jgi:hypothetical protein
MLIIIWFKGDNGYTHVLIENPSEDGYAIINLHTGRTVINGLCDSVKDFIDQFSDCVTFIEPPKL